MSFIDLAAERYSVRSYSDRLVEPEKLALILKAAQLAPTACNYQPQKIYVLKSEDALRRVRGVTEFAFRAPVVLLVCVDDTKVWQSQWEPGYNSIDMDGSIVCDHMMLAAWDLGIGSCWVRGFNAGDVSRAFDLPEHIHPVCMLFIGYPSERSHPAHLHFETRPLNEMVEER